MFKCESGSISVVSAFALPVVILTAGIAVEPGLWYVLNEKAQTAADNAAFSGALTLRAGASLEDAREAAKAAAADVGHPKNTTFVIEHPTNADGSVDTSALEVTLVYKAPRLFSNIVDNSELKHSTRAVAAFEAPRSACLLSLHPTANGAITFSGTGSTTLTGCDIMSNSIADDAFTMRGNSSASTDCVSSAGGAAFTGGSYSLTLNGCNGVRTNLSRSPDPYADVPLPDTTGPCKNIGKKETRVNAGPKGVRRFCGGLDLKTNIVFEPGVYVISGGTFRINGSGKPSGTGVTFVLTDGAELSFNGNSKFNFTAPTTGPYAGVAIYADRNDTGLDHTVNGSSSSNLTGAIYTPGSHLRFSGNFSGTNGCMQLVASTITVTGSTSIESDCGDTGINWAEAPGDIALIG